MSAFVTLAQPYNMPAPVGRVDDNTALKDTQSQSLAQPAARTQVRTALNQFLAGIELKAFRIAQAGLRHEQDALDAVQDAMLQLSRAYSDRTEEEWRPLFYRILENRIRDMQRRRTVRGRVMAWLPLRRDDEDEEPDPVAQAPATDLQPDARLSMDEAMTALDGALKVLPQRQRQAFLLRNLEGLDVAQTATAMKCSEGSVKTHYFRAVKALRAKLGEFKI